MLASSEREVPQGRLEQKYPVQATPSPSAARRRSRRRWRFTEATVSVRPLRRRMRGARAGVLLFSIRLDGDEVGPSRVRAGSRRGGAFDPDRAESGAQGRAGADGLRAADPTACLKWDVGVQRESRDVPARGPAASLVHKRVLTRWGATGRAGRPRHARWLKRRVPQPVRFRSSRCCSKEPGPRRTLGRVARARGRGCRWGTEAMQSRCVMTQVRAHLMDTRLGRSAPCPRRRRAAVRVRREVDARGRVRSLSRRCFAHGPGDR